MNFERSTNTMACSICKKKNMILFCFVIFVLGNLDPAVNFTS